MEISELVLKWFEIWKNGDFHNIPVSEDFQHTSPYGTTRGKESYLQLVEANKDKFLGHSFDIHDLIKEQDRACVRYTAIKDEFRLEVSEWYYSEDGLIKEIVAYYNIPGEIKKDRELHDPD